MHFTIVGIIDDDGASNLKDLNGESLLPLKMVAQDDKIVNATCAASEVLVLNWRTALNIAGDVTSISRIVFQIENPEEFAKTVVWQKEYTV